MSMQQKTPGRYRVSVTRQNRNGAERIQNALRRGLRVMAKTPGNWFEVGAFREVLTPEGWKIWYARGTRPNGHLSACPGETPEHFVTTVTWWERDARVTPINENQTKETKKMTNEELLHFGGPSQLLTTIELQERFILRQHVQQKPCPNCATPVNVFEAARVAVNDYTFNKSEGEPEYACPACQRRLLYILPLTGGWHWFLVPVKPGER
jgi:hypothetical protein